MGNFTKINNFKWDIPLLTVQGWNYMKNQKYQFCCSIFFAHHVSEFPPPALRSERCQDCPNHKKQPVLRSKSRVVIVRDESIMPTGHKHTQVKRKKTWQKVWYGYKNDAGSSFFLAVGMFSSSESIQACVARRQNPDTSIYFQFFWDKEPMGLLFSLQMSDWFWLWPSLRHASLNPSLTSASDIGLTCPRFWRFQHTIQLHSIQKYPYSIIFQSLFCKAQNAEAGTRTQTLTLSSFKMCAKKTSWNYTGISNNRMTEIGRSRGLQPRPCKTPPAATVLAAIFGSVWTGRPYWLLSRARAWSGFEVLSCSIYRLFI